jgi:excisionase family DNA binding protein
MAAYVTAAQVAEQLGVSVKTLRRWVAAGDFPPPISKRGHVQRWRAKTVEDWGNRREREAEKAQR